MLVKDCKYRTKKGRCEINNTYCSFHPKSVFACIIENPEKPIKKRRGKKK